MIKSYASSGQICKKKRRMATKLEKMGKRTKTQNLPVFAQTRRKCPTLSCVLCSSLVVEIEKAHAQRDAEIEKMLRVILKEHKLVSHGLN